MPIEKNGTKVVILEKRIPAGLKYIYVGTNSPGISMAVPTNPEGQTCDISGQYVSYLDENSGITRYYECMDMSTTEEVNELKKSNGDLIHKRVTITFNANGGSGGSTQRRTWGVEQITTPSTPTRSGYSFKGWYTSSSGGAKLNFPLTTPTVNATYYAQWTPITQTLKWAYKGRASTKVCFCQGINMIGSPCSTAGETMTTCGADAGTSDQCSILECRLS